jgi:hypothetical protein
MQKPIVIRIAITSYLLLLLIGCGHKDNSRDVELRQKIVGTWLPYPQSNGDTVAIMSGGNFVSKFATVRTNGPKNLIYSGTWLVKNGYWITTITNVSGSDELHEPVGSEGRSEIVSVNEHEFVYEIILHDGTNKTLITARRK